MQDSIIPIRNYLWDMNSMDQCMEIIPSLIHLVFYLLELAADKWKDANAIFDNNTLHNEEVNNMFNNL